MIRLFRSTLPLLLLIVFAGSLATSQQLAPDWVNPVKKTLKEGGVVIGGTVTAANLDTMAIMANTAPSHWKRLAT
jgi:hypothetical protein